MVAINILESHRHDLPCCNGEIHHCQCDLENLGPELPGNCRPEHTNELPSASLCWHQIKSDSKIAAAFRSDDLKLSVALISNWASQNNYEFTLVFERLTGRVADDISSDRYWDYDMTGEE